MRRVAVPATLAVVTAAALTGCATRQVDLEAAGAQPVPGFGGLYAACRGPLGIYFTNYGDGNADDYEFIVYDDPFCVQDGTEPSIDEPATPAVPTSDPSPNVSENEGEG